MSKITLDNLSDNLKAYLEGLGLSEEQVLNLINENGLDEEELKAMLKDTMSINELNTNSKTVIGAINELFQDVDNGKNLIATSIGNPLITGNSTFSAMSEAILGLRRESENETDVREVLYNMMIEDGYNEATSEMTVDELIELLDRSGIEIGDIKQIACGSKHTFILKNDGSVWACGNNDYGQLGLDTGNNNNQYTFTQVTTNINNDVKQIACGGEHTFILKNDGSVWGCGRTNKGQLGLNNTTNRATFTQVTTNINNDVKQVVCVADYTFILKNDGSVWSCGYNVDGQLGLGTSGTNNNQYTFTQVTTNINNDVKQIACGYQHAFILKNDGSVWSCGDNYYRQLGLNDSGQRTTFTQVTTNINNDVKQIACGRCHTFILKNDGSVWSCGLNSTGQLGLNNTTNRATFTQVTTNINNDVKYIACNNDFTFILKNDGSVWSCGHNSSGQSGLGTSGNSQTTFTQVTTNINNDVKQIVCGQNYTFILKNDGSVWGCGYNYYGQLGLGDVTNRNIFTNTNFSTGLSEYDIDKLALYNYLLSNDIEVTEDMDIGTMLDLLVDDYINNMILGYENNLRVILTDEGVSVNNEDNMDSLISKVDEEFDRKNNEIENSGGLDIICATELPNEVVNNQVCLITESFGKVYIANELSTSVLNESDVYIKTTTTGYYATTHIITPMNDISLNLSRIVQIKNGTEEKIDGYVGINGQWIPTDSLEFYLFKEGTGLHSSVGGFDIIESDGTYSVNNNRISLTGYKEFGDITIRSKNKIDLTEYSKLEVKSSSSSYGSFTLSVGGNVLYLSENASEPAVLNISTINGLYNIEITKGANYQNQSGTIYYIKLIKEFG